MNRRLLLSVAALVACVACCAAPATVATGWLAAAAGSLAFGWAAAAMVLLVVGAAPVAWFVLRWRRMRRRSDAGPGRPVPIQLTTRPSRQG